MHVILLFDNTCVLLQVFSFEDINRFDYKIVQFMAAKLGLSATTTTKPSERQKRKRKRLFE